MSEPRSIAVLYGGVSAERDVSLDSGQAVAAALTSRGHIVTLIDPAHAPVPAVDWTDFDVAFIALHGTYGEDGAVQRELDALRIPYTGSSAEASALAFDKARSKRVFEQSGIQTPRAARIAASDSQAGVQAAAAEIGYPVVVKPCCQGSSIGVTIVHGVSELAQAVECCFRHDDAGLIEAAVLGEEWTVAVVDGTCLRPIRIESAGTFYDYEAKYFDNRTGYHLAGPEVCSKFVSNLQRIARRACEALGVSGIARVDLMVDAESQPWVLEVNTVPGFTSHSLVPKAAAAAGMTLGELCESVLPVNQNSVPRGNRRAG